MLGRMRRTYASSFSLIVVLGLLSGCGDGSAGSDAGGPRDGGRTDAGAIDAGANDGGAIDSGNVDGGADGGASDGGPSCLDEGHEAGDRFPVGGADTCNFCTCNADGSRTCTTRVCATSPASCELGGRAYGYGERFELGDGCNECVCAASGLACTRRTCPGAREEGAILMESLNEPCGDRAGFTARAVLDELPSASLRVPFAYERDRATYPERLPDTQLSLRIAYAGGFAVCRIEAPGRAAIDLEAIAEWQTDDGAFDEGLHTYLRKNDFGFLDAWFVVASLPLGSIEGTYRPACPDAGPLAFAAQIDRSGAASGDVTKVCERDIALRVGGFDVPAP